METIIPVPIAHAMASGHDVCGEAGLRGGRLPFADFQVLRAAARVITAATTAEAALVSIHVCSSVSGFRGIVSLFPGIVKSPRNSQA